MTKFSKANRLAAAVLGSCGLALAAGGCLHEVVGDDIASVDEPEGTTTTGAPEEAETGTPEEQGESSSGGESTGGPQDEGTGTGDDTGDSTDDGGPEPLEGPGCGVRPTCDRGTYEGSVVLSDEASMAEIEGYSHVTGFVLARETDFTCLEFLACLETARGLAIERNEHLVNLDGLGALQEVLFSINISRNAALQDISGLTSLTKVSSDGDDVQLGMRGVVIFENPALEQISGFDALQELEGDLSITNNASMIEIAGFNALQSVADYPNPNKGYGQPARVGGSLILSSDKLLERVSGFTNLAVITENLVIQYNDALTELTGLHALEAIGGALVITNNPQLCVSETYQVGGTLEVGPLNLANSSTANNKPDC
jgi:hypothetical protein